MSDFVHDSIFKDAFFEGISPLYRCSRTAGHPYKAIIQCAELADSAACINNEVTRVLLLI